MTTPRPVTADRFQMRIRITEYRPIQPAPGTATTAISARRARPSRGRIAVIATTVAGVIAGILTVAAYLIGQLVGVPRRPRRAHRRRPGPARPPGRRHWPAPVWPASGCTAPAAHTTRPTDGPPNRIQNGRQNPTQRRQARRVLPTTDQQPFRKDVAAMKATHTPPIPRHRHGPDPRGAAPRCRPLPEPARLDSTPVLRPARRHGHLPTRLRLRRDHRRRHRRLPHFRAARHRHRRRPRNRRGDPRHAGLRQLARRRLRPRRRLPGQLHRRHRRLERRRRPHRSPRSPTPSPRPPTTATTPPTGGAR